MNTANEEMITHTLVLYHMDGCPYCVKPLTSFSKLDRLPPNVAVKKVNRRDVSPHSNIMGYPTIRLYNADGYINYQGDRSPESIRKFVLDNVKEVEFSPCFISRVLK